MFNEVYQLRYTREFIYALELIKQQAPTEHSQLQNRLLPDLCRYPLQGRLLLNRLPSSKESQRLRWQLAKRFANQEIREVCYDNWLVLYLHHRPYVYLLSLISLQGTFASISSDWIGEQ